MTITQTRDFETIQQQVGDITGKIPGAWWVGTDKTLPLRDEYLAGRAKDTEKRKALAESVGADPEKTWHSRQRLRGFIPLDPENPHKALREDKDTSGMWVPNKRTKAGKELYLAMEVFNRERTQEDLGGITGSVSRNMGWQMYVSCPHFVVREGLYPIVTIAEDPDNTGTEEGFDGPVTVDPELWERMPLSWIARIIEENQ